MGIEVIEEYKCESCGLVQSYRVTNLPINTRQPDSWCRIKFTTIGIPKMNLLESSRAFLLCPQCTAKLTNSSGEVQFVNDLSKLLYVDENKNKVFVSDTNEVS